MFWLLVGVCVCVCVRVCVCVCMHDLMMCFMKENSNGV